MVRPGAGPGTLAIATGLVLLGGIESSSGYLAAVLPALVFVGAGTGLAFVALTSVAVGAVAEQDSGIASGLFTAAQQIGGALGLAVLTATGPEPGPHAEAPATPSRDDRRSPAVAVGFEPTEALTSRDFESRSLGRSDTLPPTSVTDGDRVSRAGATVAMIERGRAG